MNRISLRNSRAAAVAALALAFAAMPLFTGCDDSEFEHTPPPGQGSLIVDNVSFTDLNVFLGGAFADEVNSGERRVFDINPGVYRVVLDEQDGRRTYREDIDILDGQLTVLRVTANPTDYYNYNVSVSFE